MSLAWAPSSNTRGGAYACTVASDARRCVPLPGRGPGDPRARRAGMVSTTPPWRTGCTSRELSEDRTG
ncbi:hypothetical protein QJS66_21985 [Kocuria rhizophila]|nr:hypothetical protein QJS66_21985 [Kocuria rhizophila]